MPTLPLTLQNALKAAAALALVASAALANSCVGAELKEPLDRHAIVTRHNVKGAHLESTLPIGNGNFCFNVDGTGLQTFGGNTLSHWGWYSDPLPAEFTWADVPPCGTYAQGRLTGGDPWPSDKAPLYHWVRNNPRCMNLARVRFVKKDGAPINPQDVDLLERELDLWSGVHQTTFTLGGKTVNVTTCVTDDALLDTTVAVRIESELVRSGELVVQIDFPNPDLTPGPWVGSFNDAQSTPFEIQRVDDDKALVVKRLLQNEYAQGVVGDYSYSARVDAVGGKVEQVGETSAIRVTGLDADTLDLAITFDGGDYSSFPTDDSVLTSAPVSFDEAQEISQARWETFWTSGAAVDLSESADPRWKELERRVVLSQFQLRTNSAGDWPCGESGLVTICPWSGRFQMEMVWWHLVHWWAWIALSLPTTLSRSIRKFKTTRGSLPNNSDTKDSNGKGNAPDGRTAPWVGNLVLLWKQPHPIFFAEMDYRRSPIGKLLTSGRKSSNKPPSIWLITRQRRVGRYHLAPQCPERTGHNPRRRL